MRSRSSSREIEIEIEIDIERDIYIVKDRKIGIERGDKNRKGYIVRDRKRDVERGRKREIAGGRGREEINSLAPLEKNAPLLSTRLLCSLLGNGNLALIKCDEGYDPSIYVGKPYGSSKKIKTTTCLKARLNTDLDEA